MDTPKARQARRSLAGLDPEQRLAGLGPEERLAGLNQEELATLLAQIERHLGQHKS